MATLKETVESLIERECTELSYGLVQIHTEVLYPDHDLIDIYVRAITDKYEITDLADTCGWFFIHGAERSDIEKALNNLDSERYTLIDGAIVCYVPELDENLKETVRNMALDIRKICLDYYAHIGDSK